MTILVALVIDRRSAAPPESPAPAESGQPGVPPDLSSMSPREQFDRLFNRVMAAAESGDSGTVTRFAPMALAAYRNLADPDADARYHAAMIRLHSGDPAGAAALADTILIGNRSHLLGHAIRIAIAEATRDGPGLGAARSALVTGWDAEQAAGRPEYRDHQTILTRIHDQARQAPGDRRP